MSLASVKRTFAGERLTKKDGKAALSEQAIGMGATKATPRSPDADSVA
jgi:hypothetical protein